MANLADRRSGRLWISAVFLVSTLLFSFLLMVHSAPNAASDDTGLASANAPAATCPNPIRVMLLGDSITRGYGYGFAIPPGQTDVMPEFIGFRESLYKYLANAGYHVDFIGNCQDPGPRKNNADYWCGGSGLLTEDIPGFDADHEGHGGRTTRWFLQDTNNNYPPKVGSSRLEYFLSELESKGEVPDMILLHIGMNDLVAGRSANDITADIKEMLDIIYALNPDAVVVLAKVIGCHYNDKCQETGPMLNDKIGQMPNEYVCTSGRCVLRTVDMASAVIHPQEYYDGRYHDGEDGRHPNRDGYAKMFEVWKRDLDEYLPIYCGAPGGEWVDMGTVSDNGQASEPSLAPGPTGRHIVAWSDYSGSDMEIYVKEWKNGAWVEKGTGSATGGGISDSEGDSMRVVVTVDGAGSPVVAWEERKTLGSEIYVKRWQDGSWQEMGAGSASNSGISASGDLFPGAATRPTLAYAPEGPVVAWHNYWDYSESYQIYVKRWKDGAWQEMGAGSASSGGISSSLFGAFTPSAAVHNGQVFIAWSDSLEMNSDDIFANNIYLKRWDGDSWEQMNGSFSGHGISKTEGDSYRPSLAIGSDGRPVVAWEDNTSGNYEIYVKKWDGDSWEELNGSATGGGISRTSTDSNWPSLAIGSNGLPVVAWQEVRADDVEVFGLYWDGDSWEELDGSASGGGISNYGAVASKPSLVVAVDGSPIVAWDAGIAGDYDVFVRRWHASQPPPQPTPTPAPTPSMMPSLTIDHNSGAPDSFFRLSGSDFPAGEEAAVTVNGQQLGSVPVSSAGEFECYLSTSGAGLGYYLVTATVNPTASTHFELTIDEPVWLQGGTGPVLEVPAGIAFTNRLFLPINLR